MLKKLLIILGITGLLGYGYLEKNKDIKREVAMLLNNRNYGGANEIVDRFNEYKDVTGEYPAPELFQDVLVSDNIELLDGSFYKFSSPRFIPECHEGEAGNFKFLPKYSPQGRLIGGTIYHEGLDGDDDGGDEKDLPEKLKKIDNSRLVNPVYIFFPPDGDVQLYEIAHPDSSYPAVLEDVEQYKKD